MKVYECPKRHFIATRPDTCVKRYLAMNAKAGKRDHDHYLSLPAHMKAVWDPGCIGCEIGKQRTEKHDDLSKLLNERKTCKPGN